MGPKCSSPSPLLYRRKSTLTSSGEGITSILLDVPNALRTSSQKRGVPSAGTRGVLRLGRRRCVVVHEREGNRKLWVVVPAKPALANLTEDPCPKKSRSRPVHGHMTSYFRLLHNLILSKCGEETQEFPSHWWAPGNSSKFRR